MAGKSKTSNDNFDKEFEEFMNDKLKNIDVKMFRKFYNYRLENELKLGDIEKIMEIMKIDKTQAYLIADNFSYLSKKYKNQLRKK